MKTVLGSGGQMVRSSSSRWGLIWVERRAKVPILSSEFANVVRDATRLMGIRA